MQEFLIKWLGYDDAHNSWEPRKNLTDDLVKDFSHAMRLYDHFFRSVFFSSLSCCACKCPFSRPYRPFLAWTPCTGRYVDM